MSTLALKHSPNAAIEGGSVYLCAYKLYYAYFDTIPSAKEVYGIDFALAMEWIEAELTVAKKHFKDSPPRKDYYNTGIEVNYVLEEGIIIQLCEHASIVLFDDKAQPSADMIVEKMKSFKKEYSSDESQIFMVVTAYDMLTTQPVSFKVPDIDLSQQYNDDLLPVHERVKTLLSENDRSGLILFHGKPGTGKSTYIRYLIKQTNKKFVFMTPDLAGNLGSPEIAKFLISNANCVFVIEDAEQLILSRDMGAGSSISTLLNLTDGILGESLGIQIIATFNTELYNIDKALLRKGRLLSRYEFKPLSVEKSQALLERQGISDFKLSSPMLLADIYNFNEPDQDVPERPRVGIGYK